MWYIPGLVNIQKAMEAMAQSKCRGFSQLQNGGSFHSYVTVYHRVPSGKCLHNYGKIHHLNNRDINYKWAIFYSYVSHYQRVWHFCGFISS